jgi:hypothetical protein
MVSKKWIPLVIVLLLGIAAFFLTRSGSKPEAEPKKEKKPSSNIINRDRRFDRRTAFLEYSRHAECRMDCRNISKSEVETIMSEGRINYNKSDISNARCPRYALEGKTDDGQRVRIVYVTVIDLGEDHACACPGDDDKYKNRR